MAFSEVKVVGAPLKMLGMAFFEIDGFGGKKLLKKEYYNLWSGQSDVCWKIEIKTNPKLCHVKSDVLVE